MLEKHDDKNIIIKKIDMEKLQAKLDSTIKIKKQFQTISIASGLLIILMLFIIYFYTIFDYAVIDNVEISLKEGTREVLFQYDVVSTGRVDFFYGKAILTDRKQISIGEHFTWKWYAEGDTSVSIRSRKWLFPHWNSEKYKF